MRHSLYRMAECCNSPGGDRYVNKACRINVNATTSQWSKSKRYCSITRDMLCSAGLNWRMTTTEERGADAHGCQEGVSGNRLSAAAGCAVFGAQCGFVFSR